MKKFLALLMAVILAFSLIPANGQAATYTGKDVVNIANKYLGVPYKFGGTTPDGFDCSGYLIYVFNQVGISLPRTSEDQYNKAGVSVDKKDLQVGDLVFFSNTYKPGISHAGIYVGDNNFISATNSGVVVASLDNTYWKPKYTGAKRVLNTDGSQSSSKFPDLGTDHFAYDAINTLTSQGVISGYQDGTFRPNDNVTRGQAAAIINRVLKHTATTDVSFQDVSSNHTFAKEIAAIKELGIINGFPDGTFRPNDIMTRAQMAAIVKNAFNLKQPNISSSNSDPVYSDVGPNNTFFEAITIMYEIDTTKGFKTDKYLPFQSASRADFSAAIFNGMNAR
ncbi:C40 family peptidase [Bacillus sp. JJ722]|uniref:C40 family peptidase n=1 Tax=Bacillus sp. JJ722 TaxID=3122973 RepID=UPI002FFFEA91